MTEPTLTNVTQINGELPAQVLDGLRRDCIRIGNQLVKYRESSIAEAAYTALIEFVKTLNAEDDTLTEFSEWASFTHILGTEVAE